MICPAGPALPPRSCGDASQYDASQAVDIPHWHCGGGVGCETDAIGGGGSSAEKLPLEALHTQPASSEAAGAFARRRCPQKMWMVRETKTAKNSR